MTVHLLFTSWTRSGPPRNYDAPPLPQPAHQRSSYFLLANETWDDFGFKTDFLFHVVRDTAWEYIGNVGIAYKGQQQGSTFQWLGRPSILESLPGHAFSLGSIDFYDALDGHREDREVVELLQAIRDVTLDSQLREQVKNEPAFVTSLLRSNPALEALETVSDRWGGPGHATEDQFEAIVHIAGAAEPHRFAFDFSQDVAASSRINVLVGLNGTGKTQSMASIARLISRVMSPRAAHEQEPSQDQIIPRPSIYGVVAISFSAFDHFPVPDEATSKKFRYTYCGLKSLDDRRDMTSRHALVLREVQERFEVLSVERRRKAVEPLRPSLSEITDLDAACDTGVLPHDALSAGQRIVLSVTCELLNHIRPRTLVMMDEPEIHLHPQLLSGLIAWISDLLEEKESFAIIATHSPSVVQQVRSSAVHVLLRAGDMPVIARPRIETFGANLTEIAHEVFEDHEGDRSYQDELRRLWEAHGSADAVNELFGGALRMNALMFLRTLELR